MTGCPVCIACCSSCRIAHVWPGVHSSGTAISIFMIACYSVPLLGGGLYFRRPPDRRKDLAGQDQLTVKKLLTTPGTRQAGQSGGNPGKSGARRCPPVMNRLASRTVPRWFGLRGRRRCPSRWPGRGRCRVHAARLSRRSSPSIRWCTAERYFTPLPVRGPTLRDNMSSTWTLHVAFVDRPSRSTTSRLVHRPPGLRATRGHFVICYLT
jgi:hypothetical protein